jgi:hypothetical protein
MIDLTRTCCFEKISLVQLPIIRGAEVDFVAAFVRAWIDFEAPVDADWHRLQQADTDTD